MRLPASAIRFALSMGLMYLFNMTSLSAGLPVGGIEEVSAEPRAGAGRPDLSRSVRQLFEDPGANSAAASGLLFSAVALPIVSAAYLVGLAASGSAGP